MTLNHNTTVTSHRLSNNRFFNRWAWLYDHEKFLFSPLRKKSAKFLDSKPPATILDVATGTGALAYELAKLGHHVTGTDVSPGMLTQAKKKLSHYLRLQFLEADGTNLPFKDNSFDATTVSMALHDMPYEVGMLVLTEMKRVTKKTGRIMIVDYMEPARHQTAKFLHPFISLYETKHYKPFINTGLRAYIGTAGLEVVKEDDFIGAVQMVLLKK